MNPLHPDNPLVRNEAAARWQRALRARLQSQGIVAAPPASADDIRRVRDADALLGQFVRASRHSSGAVRAFASLIADAHDEDGNTLHWVARVERAAAELDDFTARMAALRVCDAERPVSCTWNDILARVASRSGGITPNRIEAVDRSRGPFVQRAELLGRTLFHMVRNAMEASPRGAIVRVRVDESRHENARLFHVRITDDGPGVDPSLESSLWKPFVTSRRGHAGMGLAYVAAAVPVIGAAAGVRREAQHTTAHMLLGEEGGLQWE